MARYYSDILFYKILFLFDIKIVYFYVIEVSHFESNLGLHDKALISKIFAFYDLIENALGPPGRRAHVHFGNSKQFLRILRVLRVFESIFTKSKLSRANEVDTRKSWNT